MVELDLGLGKGPGDMAREDGQDIKEAPCQTRLLFTSRRACRIGVELAIVQCWRGLYRDPHSPADF